MSYKIDPLYCLSDAAKYLGFRNSQSLRNLRVQGKDPDAIVLGRSVRYRQSALEAWIEKNTQKAIGGVR